MSLILLYLTIFCTKSYLQIVFSQEDIIYTSVAYAFDFI